MCNKCYNASIYRMLDLTFDAFKSFIFLRDVVAKYSDEMNVLAHMLLGLISERG